MKTMPQPPSPICCNKFEMTYAITGLFARRNSLPGLKRCPSGGMFQKITDLIVGMQQRFHLLAQIGIFAAGFDPDIQRVRSRATGVLQ